MRERKLLLNASETHSRQDKGRMQLGQADEISNGLSKRKASSSPIRRSVKVSETVCLPDTSSNIIPTASNSKSLGAPHHLRKSNTYRSITRLQRGELVNTRLSPLEPTFYAGTPDINLLLSSDSPETLKSHYRIGLELLALNKQTAGRRPLIVDVDTMKEGEDMVFEGSSIIMLRHKDAVLIEYVLQDQNEK